MIISYIQVFRKIFDKKLKKITTILNVNIGIYYFTYIYVNTCSDINTCSDVVI